MNFILMEATAAPNTMIMNLIMLALMFVALYFVMIRPQAKRKKAEDEMRNAIKIGDEVTTIGGIIGTVVNIREDVDSLVIETGSDRNKIKVRRWAIASSISMDNAKNQ